MKRIKFDTPKELFMYFGGTEKEWEENAEGVDGVPERVWWIREWKRDPTEYDWINSVE